MPTYRYKVRDKQGRPLVGLMEGGSENEVMGSLKKMGYVPINIDEQKEKREILNIRLFAGVRDIEIVLFTRQMHTMLKAGLPLLTALEAASEQTGSSVLKDAIGKMKIDVEGGLSFSEALSKNPKIFPSLYVSMVRAGEASGLLDEIMKRLAELGEYDMELKSKIKSATRYPMLAFSTLIVAFFVIVTLVIPRFADIYKQFRVELPLPTRILLWTYKAVSDYWVITLVLAVLIIIAFVKFINSAFGRSRWDTFKLKVPIFGSLLLKVSMSRFARVGGTLIASGVTILQTLDLTADTVENVIIARAVRNIKDGVNEGKGLAGPMKVSRLFTPMVVQMVSIGEETGKLDELLINVSEYYDQQVDYAMKNLTTMIEPIFIFALAGMVLFVALAVFLPMWNMVRVFNGM